METDCGNCEYYDKEERYCKAFVCTPFSCEEKLPCEIAESEDEYYD